MRDRHRGMGNVRSKVKHNRFDKSEIPMQLPMKLQVSLIPSPGILGLAFTLDIALPRLNSNKQGHYIFKRRITPRFDK